MADAQHLDFAELVSDFSKHAAPAARGLLGLAGQLGGMIERLGGISVATSGGPVKIGGNAEPPDLPSPASEQQIKAAQEIIGRALPDGVLQLLAIANGGYGPGQGLYPVEQMAEKYRELTATPFGPSDQLWPGNLLPLFEDSPGWVSIDLDSGEIVYWDPEEIEDGESQADWQRSFKVEQETLDQAMEAWLDAPAAGDQAGMAMSSFMEDYEKRPLSPVTGWPMMLDAETQARSEIEFLTHSPSLRQDFSLPEEGWEEEVRRRHGLHP